MSTDEATESSGPAPMAIRTLSALDREILTEIYNLNVTGIRPTLWSITHTLEGPEKKRKRRRTSILVRAGYLVDTCNGKRMNLVLTRLGINALAVHDPRLVSETLEGILHD